MLRHAKMFMKRNSATILTCVGGVGVITTSVMAVKATPKAMLLIENAKTEKGEDLTKFEMVKTAVPVYIPAIVAGVGTLACIFGANMLNKRQQAALMSAYALLDNSYKDYKKKVEELYGEGVKQKVAEEIAKDKYKEADIPKESNKMLFYDDFSKRYFESTMEKVQRAEYNINRDLIMRDFAMLNEFYDYLELDHIDGGDELGWTTESNFEGYWQVWLDFGHSKITMDDGRECTVITMWEEPYMDWNN